MGFLQNIKKSLGRNKPNQNRTKKFNFIGKGTKIGVIIDADDEKNINNIEEYCKTMLLEVENVSKLHITKKEPPQNKVLPYNTVSFLNSKWKKSELLAQFYQNKYDILLVFCFRKLDEIHHIIENTNADMKVSPQYPDKNSADFTFMLKENDELNEYLGAIKMYLKEK